MRLNLGAGSALLTDWTNLDRVPMPGIDVVHDLDSGPWPFESSSMDQIMAKDVFEHVDDPILFMTECHRILRPGAGVLIHTPYYRGRDAFTDPTHKRFPTEHTFDYWIPGTVLYNANNRAYGAVAFSCRNKEIGGEHIAVYLIKIA